MGQVLDGRGLGRTGDLMRKGYLRRGGKGRISGGCRMTDWLMEVGGWLGLKRFAWTEGLGGKSVCKVGTKGTRWIILNV